MKTYPQIPKFLSFRLVTDSEISKLLYNIVSKKSTGADNIPAKIVKSCSSSVSTRMILSFQTDMPGQTVQTQIRLLSDKGLHCLPFRLYSLDSLLYGRATNFKF